MAYCGADRQMDFGIVVTVAHAYRLVYLHRFTHVVIEEVIMQLVVRVKEIRGNCPVYQLEDSFVIRKGYILEVPSGKGICMHALAALFPFYRTLAEGVSPQQMGLTSEADNKAYIQCPDAAEYTGGGTVVFEIEQVETTCDN